MTDRATPLLCAYEPCPREFIPGRPNQRYHAEACQRAAYKARTGGGTLADLSVCAYQPCGREYHPAANNQRYCSKECGTSARALIWGVGERTRLATASRGAVSEMVAACDLMERGYEVFRALSPACSCDLIALGPDGALRIEVRTGRRNTVTGQLMFARNDGRGTTKRSDGDLDHYAIVASTQVAYDPPLP